MKQGAWHYRNEKQTTDYFGTTNLPSLTESTNATTIYIRLKTVETPNQSLRADKWGIDMANKAHTNPEMAMKYGSFMTWSSLKRT
jgi:hypothetical protein